MSMTELRREIKRSVDRLPPERLKSLVDYVDFLARPSLARRLVEAEEAMASGKGVDWRKVRGDV